MNDTFRTAPVECWSCNNQLEAHQPLEAESDGPKPGSASICFRCGALAVFAETETGLGLREPTAEETIEMLNDEGILRALLTRLRVIERMA